MFERCQVLCIAVLLIGLRESCFAKSLKDYEYVEDIDGWLRLHTDPATWRDAIVRCQMEGSTLASPTTGVLTQAMKTKMAAKKLKEGWFLTGMHSQFISGKFMSLEGILLSDLALPWAKGEPNSLNNDAQCIALSGDGEMADVSCTSVHPFFCYDHSPKMSVSCGQTSDSQVNKCGSSDNGLRESYFAKSLKDYEYFEDIDGGLRLHTDPANWWDAIVRCQMEGSTLASPTTGVLTQAMKTKMAAKKLKEGWFLTGMHSQFISGKFMSLEGILLSDLALPWAKGEPNSLNNDAQCIALSGDGEMADVSCTSVHPFFCYNHSPKMSVSCGQTSDSQEVNKCGTSDNGYQLEPSTGSCYKFHRRALPWRRAAMVCAAEHAHLAVINSDLESQVLKNIFAKNPSDTIEGALWKDFAHLGFLDWNEQNEWLTIFGETLAKAGYDKWAPGEPNYPTIENCGTMTREGLLNDGRCAEILHPFICESTLK